MTALLIIGIIIAIIGAVGSISLGVYLLQKAGKACDQKTIVILDQYKVSATEEVSFTYQPKRKKPLRQMPMENFSNETIYKTSGTYEPLNTF